MKFGKVAIMFVFSLVLFASFSSFASAVSDGGGECNSSIDCTNAGLCEVASCVDGFCDYSFDDNEGPAILNLVFDDYNNGVFEVFADAEDNCSNVTNVTYYVGGDSITCSNTADVIGQMEAVDGGFDELFEEVWKNVVYKDDGSNRLCLQAGDSSENIGDCECQNFETDTIPPERLLNITLNGDSDIDELLVCGDNPTLRLTVCDSESNIQGGEFFLDLLAGTIPDTWTGYWLDVVRQYLDGGWHCADVEGQIDGNSDISLDDFSDLSEGTHNISQIRGKDIVENWGKVYDQDFDYSFIKDTVPPKTDKDLIPFDDEIVSCDESYADDNYLTDGCFYVKQGTTITLDARDFNPDNMADDIGLGDGYNNLDGEYAGDVVIHYIVYWRNSSEDDWEISQQGQSDVNEPVTITLGEDSYHLIEYWSTDGVCGNEEVHHFELDIVDTMAPEINKTILGPQKDGEDEVHKYLTKDSTIILDCVDVEPHPVGGEILYWDMYWKYNESDEWELKGSGVEEGYVEFTDLNDSYHKFEYYCKDALGNRGDVQIEIDIVDNQAPEVEKSVGEPKVESEMTEYEVPEEHDVIDTAYYVTQDTPITLSCSDVEPHPVGGEEIFYTYYNDGEMVLDWTKYNGTFTYGEDTYHELYYYCVDELGNEGDVHYELDIVDTLAPESNYDITGPVYSEQETGKTFIDNASRVVLSCSDVEPHPAGEDYIMYQYTVDGVLVQNWTEYVQGDEGIWFPEESHHVLSYYCVDKLGNEEDVNDLDFYVDHSKPMTELDFGNPYHADEGLEWISQATSITLTASDDYGEEHDSGVKEIYYKWGRVDDSNCYEVCDAQADGSVMTYDGAFNIDEDSCHVIEYWSVDNVEKTEDVNRKCIFVDTQAPDSHKILDGQIVTFNPIEGVPEYTEGQVQGYFIWKEGDTWKIRWTSDGPWRQVVGTITGESGEFSNVEEYMFEPNAEDIPNDTASWNSKKIEFDAWVDGKEDGLDFEFSGNYVTFDLTYDGNVTTEKVFIGEDSVNPISVPFSLPFTYVTQDTLVNLYCDDLGPHPVGVDKIDYRIWYKEFAEDDWSVGDWNVFGDDFAFAEDSYHMLEFYCKDLLGNEEEHRFEVDYVDTQAPVVEKTVGEPNVSCGDLGQDDCDYWVTDKTEISLECEDLGEHPVGGSDIEYRWFKDGELSQDWMNYSGPFIFNDGDSNHRLEYKCTDFLGNYGDVQVEYDKVDTAGPNVTRKFARIMRDGDGEYGEIIEGGSVGDETTVSIKNDDTVKLCAEVEDYKQTGDEGVSVWKVKYQFEGLPDPRLIWDNDEWAYCVELTGSEIRETEEGTCGNWRFEVKGIDKLGNVGEWTNGLEVVVDNVAPAVMVLNPHAGNDYYDGKIFPVYAPGIDFGGDDFWENEDDCPASGVGECTFYALDFHWENVNQTEIKDVWDLFDYLDQLGEDYTKVELGTVPYVDGACQGYLQIPEDSGLTDTVFMAIKAVDNAGNYVNMIGWDGYLALNPWISPITMNIEEKGSISITSLDGFESPTTSLKSFRVDASINSSIMGSHSCVGKILNNDSEVMFSYSSDATGNVMDGFECSINGLVKPNYPELESGSYTFEVDHVYNSEVMSSDSVEFIVDNTRPTMSVVTPAEGEVYGELFPVSLNVEDSQSPIVDEMVRFRITEIPAFGNVYCIFGGCEETSWIGLNRQDNGLYAVMINLTEEGISGLGRYTFDAVACDNLYDDTNVDIDGIPVIGEGRNGHHCVRIEIHGADEGPRPQCDDGIDNDLDGYIDYPEDNGCENSTDDDESYTYVPECGNWIVDEGEECDDGNLIDGDGCSFECIIEDEGYGDVKINEFVAGAYEDSEWIELYNPTDSAVNLTGWSLNDGASWTLLLDGEIDAYGFRLFGGFGNKLNNPGDIIKLKDSSDGLVDSVSYGDWDDGNISDNAVVPLVGNSSGRCPNGYDSDVDIDDFEIFSIPSLGSSNYCGYD